MSEMMVGQHDAYKQGVDRGFREGIQACIEIINATYSENKWQYPEINLFDIFIKIENEFKTLRDKS